MRVRFAPSPTGYLHVGGARTALYNWLLARHSGGVFVLRIEDTDQSRSTDEAIHAITEDLAWLGLGWDEGPGAGGAHGPYRQTERAGLYAVAAERLLSQGQAYHCFCTADEIEARRTAERVDARTARESHRCRYLDPAESARLLEEGTPAALRFRVEEGTTIVHDLVRGDVSFDNGTIEDFALLRRDGTATYNLAVVIDDAGMDITHVVRGDDHLPNTPKQILLYEALGAGVPLFAHLSMIVGMDGKPLSKRHADVSVGSYRERGYLPEAMVNFIALLGWSLDDKTTIMDRETLVNGFSLERVTSKPAVWDIDKLDWMNGTYIREKGDTELAEALAPFMLTAGCDMPESTLVRAAPLVKERMKVLADAVPLLRFLATDTVELEDDARPLLQGEDARSILEAALTDLESIEPFRAAEIENALRGASERLGLKPRKAFQPIRVALTGSKVSPPLFESLELLGKEKSLSRMRRALEEWVA